MASVEGKRGEETKKIGLLKGRNASEIRKPGLVSPGERYEAAIGVERATCELEHRGTEEEACVEPARYELEYSGVEHTKCELEHSSLSEIALAAESPHPDISVRVASRGVDGIVISDDIVVVSARFRQGQSTSVRTAEVSNSEFEETGVSRENLVESIMSRTSLSTSQRSEKSKRKEKSRFLAQNSCCNEKSYKMLNPLTIAPIAGSVCSVSDEEFVQIDMMVDSGATETVMAERCLDGVIDISEGAAFKRGIHYECANGSQIPNLGERKFLGITEEQGRRAVTAQACAVTKNLLSVNGMTKHGHRVVFDDDGSYIEDKSSGERSWLHEVNGMYMLKLWVSKKTSKEAGF